MGSAAFDRCLALTPIAKAIVSSALLGSLGQQVGSQLLSVLGSETCRSRLYSAEASPAGSRLR